MSNQAGNQTLFVLDTSAIVDAWRDWYAPEIILPLWDDLEELAGKSIIMIPGAVIIELESNDDELYKWCKSRERILSKPVTNEVQKILNWISSKYINLSRSGVPRSKNFADPFVIAFASHFQATVVCHESPSNDMSGPKMPDVIRDMGIRRVRFPTMVKELGLKFRN